MWVLVKSHPYLNASKALWRKASKKVLLVTIHVARAATKAHQSTGNQKGTIWRDRRWPRWLSAKPSRCELERRWFESRHLKISIKLLFTKSLACSELNYLCEKQFIVRSPVTIAKQVCKNRPLFKSIIAPSVVKFNMLMLVFTLKYQVLSQKSMIMSNLTTREDIIDFKNWPVFT